MKLVFVDEEACYGMYNFTTVNYYAALTNKYRTLSRSRTFLVKEESKNKERKGLNAAAV